jgi:hypothetical protein
MKTIKETNVYCESCLDFHNTNEMKKQEIYAFDRLQNVIYKCFKTEKNLMIINLNLSL